MAHSPLRVLKAPGLVRGAAPKHPRQHIVLPAPRESKHKKGSEKEVGEYQPQGHRLVAAVFGSISLDPVIEHLRHKEAHQEELHIARPTGQTQWRPTVDGRGKS